MENYTIITFNYGNYELLREPVVVSENCEYICVTDNHNLKSKVWKFVYDEENNTSNLNSRERYLKAKSLFLNYINTNYAIRIDGSLEVVGNCDDIIKMFDEGGYDLACMTHSSRNNAISEYDAWISQRGVNPTFKKLYIEYCNSIGFDVNTKGLFETMLTIQKNNEINKYLNEETYNIMCKVNNFKDIVKQIWYSMLVMKNFDKLKTMFFYHRQPMNSKYFQLYYHNTMVKNIEQYDTTKDAYCIFNNQTLKCQYL